MLQTILELAFVSASIFSLILALTFELTANPLAFKRVAIVLHPFSLTMKQTFRPFSFGDGFFSDIFTLWSVKFGRFKRKSSHIYTPRSKAKSALQKSTLKDFSLKCAQISPVNFAESMRQIVLKIATILTRGKLVNIFTASLPQIIHKFSHIARFCHLVIILVTL